MSEDTDSVVFSGTVDSPLSDDLPSLCSSTAQRLEGPILGRPQSNIGIAFNVTDREYDSVSDDVMIHSKKRGPDGTEFIQTLKSRKLDDEVVSLCSQDIARPENHACLCCRRTNGPLPHFTRHQTLTPSENLGRFTDSRPVWPYDLFEATPLDSLAFLPISHHTAELIGADALHPRSSGFHHYLSDEWKSREQGSLLAEYLQIAGGQPSVQEHRSARDDRVVDGEAVSLLDVVHLGSESTWLTRGCLFGLLGLYPPPVVWYAPTTQQSNSSASQRRRGNGKGIASLRRHHDDSRLWSSEESHPFNELLKLPQNIPIATSESYKPENTVKNPVKTLIARSCPECDHAWSCHKMLSTMALSIDSASNQFIPISITLPVNPLTNSIPVVCENLEHGYWVNENDGEETRMATDPSWMDRCMANSSPFWYHAYDDPLGQLAFHPLNSRVEAMGNWSTPIGLFGQMYHEVGGNSLLNYSSESQHQIKSSGLSLLESSGYLSSNGSLTPALKSSHPNQVLCLFGGRSVRQIGGPRHPPAKTAIVRRNSDDRPWLQVPAWCHGTKGRHVLSSLLLRSSQGLGILAHWKRTQEIQDLKLRRCEALIELFGVPRNCIHFRMLLDGIATFNRTIAELTSRSLGCVCDTPFRPGATVGSSRNFSNAFGFENKEDHAGGEVSSLLPFELNNKNFLILAKLPSLTTFRSFTRSIHLRELLTADENDSGLRTLCSFDSEKEYPLNRSNDHLHNPSVVNSITEEMWIKFPEGLRRRILCSSYWCILHMYQSPKLYSVVESVLAMTAMLPRSASALVGTHVSHVNWPHPWKLLLRLLQVHDSSDSGTLLDLSSQPKNLPVHLQDLSRNALNLFSSFQHPKVLSFLLWPSVPCLMEEIVNQIMITLEIRLTTYGRVRGGSYQQREYAHFDPPLDLISSIGPTMDDILHCGGKGTHDDDLDTKWIKRKGQRSDPPEPLSYALKCLLAVSTYVHCTHHSHDSNTIPQSRVRAVYYKRFISAIRKTCIKKDSTTGKHDVNHILATLYGSLRLLIPACMGFGFSYHQRLDPVTPDILTSDDGSSTGEYEVQLISKRSFMKEIDALWPLVKHLFVAISSGTPPALDEAAMQWYVGRTWCHPRSTLIHSIVKVFSVDSISGLICPEGFTESLMPQSSNITAQIDWLSVMSMPGIESSVFYELASCKTVCSKDAVLTIALGVMRFQESLRAFKFLEDPNLRSMSSKQARLRLMSHYMGDLFEDPTWSDIRAALNHPVLQYLHGPLPGKSSEWSRNTHQSVLDSPTNVRDGSGALVARVVRSFWLRLFFCTYSSDLVQQLSASSSSTGDTVANDNGVSIRSLLTPLDTRPGCAVAKSIKSKALSDKDVHSDNEDLNTVLSAHAQRELLYLSAGVSEDAFPMVYLYPITMNLVADLTKLDQPLTHEDDAVRCSQQLRKLIVRANSFHCFMADICSKSVEHLLNESQDRSIPLCSGCELCGVLGPDCGLYLLSDLSMLLTRTLQLVSHQVDVKKGTAMRRRIKNCAISLKRAHAELRSRLSCDDLIHRFKLIRGLNYILYDEIDSKPPLTRLSMVPLFPSITPLWSRDNFETPGSAGRKNAFLVTKFLMRMEDEELMQMRKSDAFHQAETKTIQSRSLVMIALWNHLERCADSLCGTV
eukprot:GHVH01012894.1.p1 GENE.GHVH01012894.1~~GHVH01012894.1.p1  ORF type:complete len:1650 (-),score=206.66 GHVH01012894.1:524-5473(-)